MVVVLNLLSFINVMGLIHLMSFGNNMTFNIMWVMVNRMRPVVIVVK